MRVPEGRSGDSWGMPSTFDAEDAPGLVEEVFGTVEVDRWSVVAYELPDRASIADYLHAFNIENWQRKANAMRGPLTITKAGAEVWASKQDEMHSSARTTRSPAPPYASYRRPRAAP